MSKTLRCGLIILGLFILLQFQAKPVFAATLAQQTDGYSSSLNVWEAFQELGTNLNGPLGSLTFRVWTDLPNNQQFDFTAQNSRIYDKSNNTIVAFGCVKPGTNPNDKLRGLTFKTEGVPSGFQDVTIDFSCHNYNFVPGRRYMVRIGNANKASAGGSRMHIASIAYQTSGNDYFPGGGLRYAFDNASCDPLRYVWNSQSANNGCNVWTTPRDDIYFILSDTTPTPTPSPTPTPTPSPTPPPAKTPLILIPGIGGSELKVAEDTFWIDKDNGHGGIFSRAYAKDEVVWLNEPEARALGEDDYFDVLRMHEDGINSQANIEITGNLLSRAYGNTIQFFTSDEMGYTLNEDFFVFPYDWRKDLSESSNLLDQKIQSIKTQTNSQKVDIVAHSMGGLVARNYISSQQKAQDINRLFTLGTPHLGSVELLKNLMYGGCLKYPVGPFCLSLAPSELKDVLQNMISSFQLAPTQKYFDFYSTYPYKVNSDQLNYQQIKNLLTSRAHNTSLFAPAETFHLLDNNLSNTNGVDVINIVGSGMPTLGQIIEREINFSRIKFSKKDLININGDKTVPLFSASLIDPTKNLSLLGGAKVFYTNQEHGSLVTSGPALELIKNILSGSTQLPTGISTQPYKFTGSQVSVHSPVDIHVYDPAGNHTGPTEGGDFEANIPGSSYQTLGDAKFIFLPEEGVYNIKFVATGKGNFDFKIRKYEDDLNSETLLYKDIPLTETSEGETIFDTTSNQPPVLSIDQKEFKVTATVLDDANYDQTPPKLSIDTNPKTIWPPNNKMVDVTVTGSAIDENLLSVKFFVEDEYSLIQPVITSFNQVIKLEASRNGEDKDGRKYIIRVVAEDMAENISEASVEILVPHDQGKKR